MQFFGPIIAAALILNLAGCTSTNSGNAAHSSNGSATASNADAPRDNNDEFELLVKLPFPPDDVVWKETAPNPATAPDASATKRLIAAMRFSHERADRLAEELGRSHPPVSENLDAESWYPAELVAQSNLSGEGKIAGQSYAADELLQPPYTQGKITRIGNTDFFILEIFGR